MTPDLVPLRCNDLPGIPGNVTVDPAWVHIRDDVLTPEGRIDIARIRPLARLGYLDYTSVESGFTMPPPDGPNAERSRLGL